MYYSGAPGHNYWYWHGNKPKYDYLSSKTCLFAKKNDGNQLKVDYQNNGSSWAVTSFDRNILDKF